MRRLLVALLLLVSGVEAPVGQAAGVGPGRVFHVPGRVSLAPAGSAREWLHEQYEAIAGSAPAAREVLRRYETGPAGEFDIETAFLAGDLDGDRVDDVVRYNGQYETEDFGEIQVPIGSLELTVYSGRTGARRWHRRFDPIPLALPAFVEVGSGDRLGLALLAAQYEDPGPGVSFGPAMSIRTIGLSGARGTTVYDVKISTTDGRGEVQYGGTFDAFTGGGADHLFGRVRTLGGSPLVRAMEVEPVVLDGRNGTLRSVHAPELVVGTGAAFVAVGDVDRDRRDDYVRVVRVDRGRGEVALYGVVEEQRFWAVPDVPTGWSVRHGGTADIAGDGKRDVVLDSWVNDGEGLLEIAGVTDGLPFLSSPPDGIHGLLFDGGAGRLVWDRLDALLAGYQPWADLNRDGKTDVLGIGLVRGDRDGLRVVAVTGTNRAIYRRDITVLPPVGRTGVSVGSFWAGDLDGDRVEDLWFYVVSASRVQQEVKEGFLLVGRNVATVTSDFPLGGTLDGRTADRVVETERNGVTTLTVKDGWNGGAYWTLRASGENAGFGLYALRGARGKCAGALLVGQSRDTLWIAALDGATGRTRWSQRLFGPARRFTVTATGRRASCR